MKNFAEHSDLNTRHSMFVAEQSPDARWWSWKQGVRNGDTNGNWKDELEELHNGKGALWHTFIPNTGWT
jgi:hypothetical protein